MKKRTWFVLGAAAVALLAACGVKKPAVIGGVHMANPFVTYDTLADAEQAAGFSFAVPETVEGYPEKLVQLMSGKMLQVIFLRDGSRLILRKEKGTGDVSGDYNAYPQTESVDGVTLRGAEGRVRCAVWEKDGFTYALTCDEPLERGFALVLIGQTE